jgi:hypothetical protein
LDGISRVTEMMRSGRLKIIRTACGPLIRELSSYCYDVRKPSETPVKENDHACDALRYLIVGSTRGKRIDVPDEEFEDAAPEHDEDDPFAGLAAKLAAADLREFDSW